MQPGLPARFNGITGRYSFDFSSQSIYGKRGINPTTSTRFSGQEQSEKTSTNPPWYTPIQKVFKRIRQFFSRVSQAISGFFDWLRGKTKPSNNNKTEGTPLSTREDASPPTETSQPVAEQRQERLLHGKTLEAIRVEFEQAFPQSSGMKDFIDSFLATYLGIQQAGEDKRGPALHIRVDSKNKELRESFTKLLAKTLYGNESRFFIFNCRDFLASLSPEMAKLKEEKGLETVKLSDLPSETISSAFNQEFYNRTDLRNKVILVDDFQALRLLNSEALATITESLKPLLKGDAEHLDNSVLIYSASPFQVPQQGEMDILMAKIENPFWKNDVLRSTMKRLRDKFLFIKAVNLDE